MSLIDIILLTNKSIADFFRNIRSLFLKRKKIQHAEEADFDDMQPVIEENGDDISLRFDKPKVIDFRIEKTARELKKQQKSRGSTSAGKTDLTDEDVTDESITADQDEQPIGLIASDIRKSQRRKKPVRSSADTGMTEDEEPGLREIVIKDRQAKSRAEVHFSI